MKNLKIFQYLTVVWVKYCGFGLFKHMELVSVLQGIIIHRFLWNCGGTQIWVSTWPQMKIVKIFEHFTILRGKNIDILAYLGTCSTVNTLILESFNRLAWDLQRTLEVVQGQTPLKFSTTPSTMAECQGSKGLQWGFVHLPVTILYF